MMMMITTMSSIVKLSEFSEVTFSIFMPQKELNLKQYLPKGTNLVCFTAFKNKPQRKRYCLNATVSI